MQALTICQPYAHLIVIGEKRVENRDWPTHYRGPLLIHAGKNRTWLDGATDDELREEFGELLPFGAIVGRATLADCLHIDTIKRGEHDQRYPWLREHYHTNGTWCWILERVSRFVTPVPWKGAQRLFNIPDAAVDSSSTVAGVLVQPRFDHDPKMVRGSQQ